MTFLKKSLRDQAGNSAHKVEVKSISNKIITFANTDFIGKPVPFAKFCKDF